VTSKLIVALRGARPAIAATVMSPTTGAAEPDFARDIRPLLNKHCAECHGGVKQKGSEFGRTQLGENRRGREPNTGRDHHPNAFTIFMAGGGVKRGLVYGETDQIGWEAVRDPVHVNDFQATLLHLFGLDHRSLTYRHGGADKRLTSLTRESHVITDWIA
jgi:hypothetical protein